MLHGIHRGIGVITLVTGIHGINTPGITITVISITITDIITAITVNGTIIGIPDGTTIITITGAPIHRISIIE
jgi:hypothetical protein